MKGSRARKAVAIKDGTLIVAVDVGMVSRQSNLLNLKWSQISLPSGPIVVEGFQMKNKDSIGLPLTVEAHETLTELQKIKHIEGFVFHDKGGRIHCLKLQRTFRKACIKARITDFRFHDLRHTFASYLRQKGVDLHIISKLLGHKDIRMTQRYAHLSVESVRGAISVLDNKKNGYNLVTIQETKDAKAV